MNLKLPVEANDFVKSLLALGKVPIAGLPLGR